VGTREENLAACLEIVAEQIAAVASGDVREEEIARAKENLKGRIMLSMELTSNRMSRLGKSLITDSELLSLDRILAEIEAVDIGSVAELADLLFARDQLSAAAIGPKENRLTSALEPLSPSLVSAAAA
jgi:predicted Zn-dependent peptidase